MATIRPERPADAAAADAIVAERFGPGRYAKTAYRLREGVKPIAGLSFVAEIDGRIIGTVRYWPVDIGGTAALMQTSLDAARALGHRAVVLVGDEPYYGRVGFKRLQPMGRITMPGPVDLARLLGVSLVDGALEEMAGEVRKARLDEPVAAPGCALG